MEEVFYEAAALGLRAWRLTPEGRLHSMGRGNTTWKCGLNKAHCLKEDHLAPQIDCSCGLYAYHSPHEAEGLYAIEGAIIAKGRLEVHEEGFRAEEAQIVALRLPTGPGAGQGTLVRDLTERAGEFYDVPLFRTAHELGTYVRSLASPVPRPIRPRAQAISTKTSSLDFGYTHSWLDGKREREL